MSATNEVQTLHIPKNEPHTKVKWYRDWLIELGLAFLISLLFTRNLVFNLTDKVPTDGSDVYENLWNYWQWQHNFFERHVNPYFTDYVYYPTGINLYLHSFQPLVSVQAVFLGLFFGPLAALNLVILLALTLATWGAYRLFLYLVGQRLAGWVGAVVFVWCNPWLWDYLKSGQVNLVSLQWLPFYTLALLKSFDTDGRRQWLWAGFASLCLLACSLTEWYYTLHLVILTIVVTFFYMLVRRQGWRARGLIFGKAALIGGVWLVLVSPLLVNMLSQANNRQWLVPSQSQTVLRSVDLLSFGLPNSHNPFYGGLVQALNPASFYTNYNPSGVDGSFNAGYVPLGLAVVAVVAGLRFRRLKVGLWLWLAAIFGLLALGPVLHLGGQTFDGIKLPYWYLYNVPGLNISRDPSNFSVPYTLALAALASLGFRQVWEWAGRQKPLRLGWLSRSVRPATALSLVLIVLIGAEFASLDIPMGLDDVPAFYRTTLAADPADYAILELPSYVQDSGLEHRRMYYQTFHHKKLLGGQLARDHKRLGPTDFLTHSSLFPEALLTDSGIAPAASDFLTRPDYPTQSASVLNYFNIRYIVTYPGVITTPDEKAQAASFLHRALGPDPRPVYSDQTITAYKVPPVSASSPSVLADVGQGWFKPDSAGGQTWRWGQFGQSAEVYLLNLTDQPRKVTLSFAAFSYAVPRNMRLTLNADHDLITYPLPASSPGQPHNEKSLSLQVELKPGNNILTFYTFEPPVIPANLPNSPDPDGRKLAYGIRDFKVSF